MWKYVIKRLLLIFPILLLVTFVVFYILNITPGDPVRIILGIEAPQEAVDDLTEELGLNDPFLVRFFDYIKGVIHLDLAVLTVTVSTLVGVPLGIVSAVKEYSALDVSLTVTSLIFASVPGFWLGLMLIMIFSLKLGLLPSSGADSLEYFILPVMATALPAAAFNARITRTQMLEVMRQEYIRTARAKGASESRVIWRHALKNTLMPVITLVGSSFATCLGGSMVTETVFGLPGVGSHILTAIQSKDLPVVMAATLFLATTFMVIMLIVDLIYAYINPTIRSQFTRK